MSYYSAYENRVPVSELVGKTLNAVTINDAQDEIEFVAESGERFRMYHEQDCCESVGINDISGDISDLVGSPVVLAEEATSEAAPEGVTPPQYGWDDSNTWTFYRLATARGFVVIRWHGSSNGYYSESVDFIRLPPHE